MEGSSPESERRRRPWVEIGLGGFFFALSFVVDAIRVSMDSGVFDVGPAGLRWLLRLFGVALLGAGIWTLARRGR